MAAHEMRRQQQSSSSAGAGGGAGMSRHNNPFTVAGYLQDDSTTSGVQQILHGMIQDDVDEGLIFSDSEPPTSN